VVAETSGVSISILMYSLILSEMAYPMLLLILIVKVALDFGMADLTCHMTSKISHIYKT
jgi:hypothetical protein